MKKLFTFKTNDGITITYYDGDGTEENLGWTYMSEKDIHVVIVPQFIPCSTLSHELRHLCEDTIDCSNWPEPIRR